MAMYVPLREGHYRATEHTQGPWDPRTQHLGPVTALIVHELARTAPRPGLGLAKLNVDVFAPVPVAELAVRTEGVRDGKRVQCLAASVSSGGREYVRATAWRIREAETPGARRPPPPLPPREDAPSWLSTGFGYGRATEWRFTRGSPDETGPAAAWGRARVPLVRDEEITPLERLALFADCGNGISYTLPFDGYLFVNVDLVISLFRAPVGEWICLDAETVVGPSGRGLARSTLDSADGEIGSASRTLFVSPR